MRSPYDSCLKFVLRSLDPQRGMGWIFLLCGCFAVFAFPEQTQAFERSLSDTLKEEDKPVSKSKKNAASGGGAIERVHVRGVRAHLVDIPLQESGIKADYLNKEADFGPLGKQKLIKAPFSVMQVSHDVVENQQLRTIDQMTKFMPSVQMEARSDPSFLRMVNRGFEADPMQNSRIDGLNVLMYTPYATEQFSGMTVLNGAAGALYGPESPAGLMEMTLKRPTKTPFFNFNFAWDSNGAPMETLDTSLGKGPVKIRFNYLNQTGQSYVSTSNMWRNLYSGDIDIQLAKHTKVELDAGQYNTSYHGLPGYFGYGINIKLPNAPNAATPGFGQANGGSNVSTSLGAMKLYHDFSPNLHLKIGGLYEDSQRYLFSVANKLTDNNGDYTQNMATPSNGQAFHIWSNFAYLNTDVHTGFITHHLNLGSNGYSNKNFAPLGVSPTLPLDKANIDDPKVISSTEQTRKWGSYLNTHIQQQALIFGDNMDIGRNFSVMGEFSWGWIQTNNYKNPVSNKAGKGTAGQTNVNGAFSPSVTFTYHPNDHFSAYFNWGTSVQAGPTASSGSANAGEVLPAIRSYQYEGGIKYLYRKNWSLNLDGFSMARPYGSTDPQTNLYGLYGLQHDYGIEFQTSGAITRDLSVLGGVTWLHPMVENTGSALTNHKQVVGVPEWSTNFLFDFHPHFIPGLGLNANVKYESERPANVYNTSWAQQFVTLDMGVRYAKKLCDHMTVFRFGVDNVTNEQYWSSVYATSSPGIVTPGSKAGSSTASLAPPRTYHVTASIYF